MENREELGVIPEILTEELDKLVEDIYEKTIGLREVWNLRDKLVVDKIPDVSRKYCLYSVDSGFTAPSLEIVSGYFGIIIVSELISGDNCSYPPRCRAYVEYHPLRDLTSMKARYYERLSLRKVLGEKINNKVVFDIAILDGEILYRGFEAWRVFREEKETARKIVEATNEVFEKSLETNTPIVGVLKRSYSKDLSIIYGLENIELNDRLVMTLLLKPGEMCIIGSYEDIYKKYIEARENRKNDREYIYVRTKWLRELRETYRDFFGEVKVVFYKPENPPNALAVKTEIFPSNWSIGEIVSVLNKTSGKTGFPITVDYVDYLSTIPYSVKELVLNMIKSKLSLRNTELGDLLMKYMNPQRSST